MSYVVLATITVLLVCAWIISYKYLRRRPNRLIPTKARRRRTLNEEALALAFAALYKRYADEAYPHFVLEEDRKLVAAIVRGFIRERRDRLGEMYLGPHVFEAGEDEMAESTVDKAIGLFLQI